VPLDLDRTLTLNNKIVLRYEEFGGTIGSGDSDKLLFVDKELFEIVSSLKGREFSVRQISIEFSKNPDQVLSIFSNLSSKGFLVQ